MTSGPNKLTFKGAALGAVSNIQYDFPWFYGDFQPTEVFTPLREGFIALTSGNLDETILQAIDPDLLEDVNWIIVDSDGNEHGISLPSIDPTENSIEWRPRPL